MMTVEIDFQSDEAIYRQIRNQIVMQIACSLLREGDPLPPVRQLAQEAGINMHTVNKAYGILQQEGFVTIDRRRGAVIALDADGAKADDLREQFTLLLAQASCRRMNREQIHALVDDILLSFER